MRELNNNGNWKGGISKFKKADELLSMDKSVRDEILKRLQENVNKDIWGFWL